MITTASVHLEPDDKVRIEIIQPQGVDRLALRIGDTVTLHGERPTLAAVLQDALRRLYVEPPQPEASEARVTSLPASLGARVAWAADGATPLGGGPDAA